jgi:hypothetical protein
VSTSRWTGSLDPYMSTRPIRASAIERLASAGPRAPLQGLASSTYSAVLLEYDAWPPKNVSVTPPHRDSAILTCACAAPNHEDSDGPTLLRLDDSRSRSMVIKSTQSAPRGTLCTIDGEDPSAKTLVAHHVLGSLVKPMDRARARCRARHLGRRVRDGARLEGWVAIPRSSLESSSRLALLELATPGLAGGSTASTDAVSVEGPSALHAAKMMVNMVTTIFVECLMKILLEGSQ